MIEMNVLTPVPSDERPLLGEGHVQSPNESSADKDTSRPASRLGRKVRLHKELSVLFGVGLLITDIIGSGIFLSPNGVIKRTGSYGLALIVWVISGIVSACGALCYGELSTLIRKSGADYAYIKEAYTFQNRNKFVTTFGNLISFTYLWMNFFVSEPMSIAIGGLLAAEYLIKPIYLDCDPPLFAMKMLAITIVAIPAILNGYSVKLTLRIITVISVVKFIACACIAVLGIYQIAVGGCELQFAGSHFFEGSQYSVSGLSLAFYSALYAYDGWTSLNFVTEESQNVGTISKSIIIGMPIIIFCYVVVNLSFFAVLSVNELASSSAVALPFGYKVLGTAGEVIFSLFVPLSVFGALCSIILTGARLRLVAARDGLVPTFLSGIHNNNVTPVPAILLQTTLGVTAILSGNLAQLVDSYSTGGWLYYGLVFGGLLIMRVTHRKIKRSFKVFIGIPIMMVFVAMFLVFLPIIREPIHSIVAFSLISSGIPVYFIFVHEHKWRPKIFTRINASLTRFFGALLNTSLSAQHDDETIS